VHISKTLDTKRFEPSATVLGALADPTRLAILDLLSDTPKCACDIGDAVKIAPNRLSYHLKVLKETGLIVGKKRGRWIDYSVAPSAWKMIRQALPAGYGPGTKRSRP